MFLLASCSFVFQLSLAERRPTNNKNRKQKDITKKLASFITTLSTMMSNYDEL